MDRMTYCPLLVPGGLTFMVLQWRVGVANSHKDEEEEEGPQQFYKELDLEGRAGRRSWCT